MNNLLYTIQKNITNTEKYHITDTNRYYRYYRYYNGS